jgi:MFS family permease
MNQIEAPREPQPMASLPPYPSSARAWSVVAILTLIYVVSFLDRSIINLLVGPIKADFGLSDVEMSYLMGPAFAVFYAIFGLPLGRLADRTNRKRLIAAGLFLWSLMTAGSAAARSYLGLFLFRVGVGVGEASLGPSAFSMLTDLFPRRRLATAISVYSTGIYIGAGISTVVGGYIAAFAVQRGEVVLPLIGEIRAWQLVFLCVGLLGLIPLLILMLLVREPVRRGASGMATEPVPIGDFLGYWKENRRSILLHHFGFTILAISGYGVGGWVPEFMVRTYGWSISQVGLVVGLNAAVVGTLGIVSGGLLADRLLVQGKVDSKIRVGRLSALGWLPFGLIFPLMPNGWACFAVLIPTTFMSSLATGCAAAAVQELFPNRMRGQASAIYLFLASLVGLGVGPTLIALCTDQLFGDESMLRYSMVLVGGLAHIVAGLFFWLCLSSYRRSLERVAEYERGQV